VPVTTEKPEAPSDDKRWRIVDTRMRRLGERPEALIEVLHSVQEAFGYLDTDALAYVGASLGVPPSKAAPGSSRSSTGSPTRPRPRVRGALAGTCRPPG
jgi:hypothetical protein